MHCRLSRIRRARQGVPALERLVQYVPSVSTQHLVDLMSAAPVATTHRSHMRRREHVKKVDLLRFVALGIRDWAAQPHSKA